MELLFGLSWLVAAVLAVAIHVWYNFIFNHFWKTLNVPADDLLSNFKVFVLNSNNKPLFRIYDSLYKKHGRFYGVYHGIWPVLVISKPELLRQILIKDFHIFSAGRQLPKPEAPYDKMLVTLEGEEWKRMRTILTPVFTSGKIRKLATYINQASETATNCLLKAADSDTRVDLIRLFGGFAMDVIASTAFATQLDSVNNPDSVFVTKSKHVFGFHYTWRKIVAVMAPGIMRAFNMNIADPEIALFFSNLISDIRNRRLKEGKSPDDFLQMLIEAESETANDDRQLVGGHFTTDQEDIKNKKNTMRTLSPDELVAQCMMFFLGGYHTTSAAISLTCYNLAHEPECQEKLLKELDETWDKHGKFDVDIVSSMKYLNAVVSENLRLYPSAARLVRTCGEDYQLGNTGITIPKGIEINVPVYAMHHDSEFFPDPDTFNPDRFLPVNKDLIQPYTYLPFGAGPRSCIAMRFALMEVKLCLANVLHHVSFHTCSETKEIIDCFTGVGLIQPREVIVKVKKRIH